MTSGSLLARFPELGQRTHLMAILNVTPDSFSDGGRHFDTERAIEAGIAAFAAGADLVDVGGESTRPGAAPIEAAEEIRRVVPVIAGLAGHGPLSVDTNKAAVAAAALEAGACCVNDVSGGAFDPALLEIVAARGASVCLMHTRGRPAEMQVGEWSYSGGVLHAVCEALAESAARAERAGVAREAILLDPGIGFGKTVDENLALLRGLPELKALGYPVLVGTSRKSFLGALTGRSVEDRIYATAASVALCVAYGADWVRVHDVGAMRDVVRVADALERAR